MTDADDPSSPQTAQTARRDACEEVDGFAALVGWIRQGAKPDGPFRIGTEYERLAIGPDGQPLPYEGEASIRALLEGLAERFGWTPTMEGDAIIGLSRDGASVSLEPAGQFELSGAPLTTVTEMAAERDQHLAEVRAVAEPLGIRFAWVGANPITRLDEVPRMPKRRYGIMRRRMPRVGKLGLQMMHLTCTVQVNLDFANDLVAMEMMRLGHLTTPATIALFAHSPAILGADMDYASWRAQIWRDVEAARCLPPPGVWAPGARIEDYACWAFNVPMYFVRVPDGDGGWRYREPEPDAVQRPLTFRRFAEEGAFGRRPTFEDWELHLSTLFPDVRLKRYLELRGADVVPPALLPCLPAFARGLFYDDSARRSALALLTEAESVAGHEALRAAACRRGLDARVGPVALRELAGSLLELADAGLRRIEDTQGPDPVAHEALAALRALQRGTSASLADRVRDAVKRGPPDQVLSALAER